MKILLSLFAYLLIMNSIAQESEKLTGMVVDSTGKNAIDSVRVEMKKSNDFSTRNYLRIVKPDSTIDYKILNVKPAPDIDYKILEIDNSKKDAIIDTLKPIK